MSPGWLGRSPGWRHFWRRLKNMKKADWERDKTLFTTIMEVLLAIKNPLFGIPTLDVVFSHQTNDKTCTVYVCGWFFLLTFTSLKHPQSSFTLLLYFHIFQFQLKPRRLEEPKWPRDDHLVHWTCVRGLALTRFEPVGHGDVPGRDHQDHGARHFHTEGLHHTQIPSTHSGQNTDIYNVYGQHSFIRLESNEINLRGQNMTS